MIRLCAFDLDGTLLGADKQVSPETARAVRSLNEQGAVIAVASARPACYTAGYLWEIGIDGLVIATNGSYVAESTGRILYEHPFPAPLLCALTSYLTERKLGFCLLSRDGITSSRPMEPEVLARFTRYGEMARSHGVIVPPPEVGDLCGTLRSDILKISVFGTTEELKAELAGIAKTFPSLSCALSSATVGDVNLAGDDKGSGVRRAAAALGIRKEEICCFGDYDNDIAMFREAGCAVAMGNGTAAAKDAADFVTLSNAEDGVAYAIEKILPSYGKGAV